MSGGPALGPALDLRPPRSLTDLQFRRKCGKSSEESGEPNRKGDEDTELELGENCGEGSTLDSLPICDWNF